MLNYEPPSFIKKYFWGDNLSELNLEKNKLYIIQTVLEKGDQKAISWLFSNFGREEVKKILPSLKLGIKSAYFWKIYFS